MQDKESAELGDRQAKHSPHEAAVGPRQKQQKLPPKSLVHADKMPPVRNGKHPQTMRPANSAQAPAAVGSKGKSLPNNPPPRPAIPGTKATAAAASPRPVSVQGSGGMRSPAVQLPSQPPTASPRPQISTMRVGTVEIEVVRTPSQVIYRLPKDRTVNSLTPEEHKYVMEAINKLHGQQRVRPQRPTPQSPPQLLPSQTNRASLARPQPAATKTYPISTMTATPTGMRPVRPRPPSDAPTQQPRPLLPIQARTASLSRPLATSAVSREASRPTNITNVRGAAATPKSYTGAEPQQKTLSAVDTQALIQKLRNLQNSQSLAGSLAAKLTPEQLLKFLSTSLPMLASTTEPSSPQVLTAAPSMPESGVQTPASPNRPFTMPATPTRGSDGQSLGTGVEKRRQSKAGGQPPKRQCMYSHGNGDSSSYRLSSPSAVPSCPLDSPMVAATLTDSAAPTGGQEEAQSLSSIAKRTSSPSLASASMLASTITRDPSLLEEPFASIGGPRILPCPSNAAAVTTTTHIPTVSKFASDAGAAADGSVTSTQAPASPCKQQKTSPPRAMPAIPRASPEAVLKALRPAFISRPPRELLEAHIATVKSRFRAALNADYEAVRSPNIHQPFINHTDLVQRLLPYHVFQYPEVLLEPGPEFDRDCHISGKRLQDSANALIDRFERLRLKEDRAVPISASNGLPPSPTGCSKDTAGNQRFPRTFAGTDDIDHICLEMLRLEGAQEQYQSVHGEWQQLLQSRTDVDPNSTSTFILPEVPYASSLTHPDMS